MEQFETYFGLQFAYLLFAPAEQFSTNVQSVDITVQEVVRGARFLVSHLKSLRTKTMFNRFYDQTLKDHNLWQRSQNFQETASYRNSLIPMDHELINIKVQKTCIIILIMRY